MKGAARTPVPFGSLGQWAVLIVAILMVEAKERYLRWRAR